MAGKSDELKNLTSEQKRLLLEQLRQTAQKNPPQSQPSSAKLAAEGGNVSAEPIAIVGMACRFPGANNIGEYWQLLAGGRHAIGEIPAERWDPNYKFNPDPTSEATTYTRAGGFIDGGLSFDAEFFGISNAEAQALDPQQRILLEVAWHSLEDAGIDPTGLMGREVGHYFGIMWADYRENLLSSVRRSRFESHVITGCSFSSIGHLSYFLGTQGPVVPVDTACSSSLVAAHLACQALRAGECELALCGGTSLMLSPDNYILLSQLHALSPTGLPRTFDSRADGFVRGEGCGVLVLKRLSDATRDGDRIHALILGSSVNHDGRSSSLTAPNEMAQRTLIASALRRAKVKATEVSYMEAHGTGTPLGDPIEFRAFSSVLGADRQKDNPLWIGSAKTNIGHAEAAAGVAGMIKVALAMRHGVIPPHLHFTSINPNIDLAESQAQIPMRLEPWTHKRKIAGVSSFGMLGTNSHVVMEALDSAAAGDPANRYAPASQETVARVLTISAKTTSSLEALLTSYISELGRDESKVDWSGLCNTAARRRAHLAERVAVVAKSKLQAATRLTEFLKNGVAPGVAKGRVRHGDRRKIAFLFSGQGSQYIGMGADLYEKSLVFRTYFDRVNEMIRSLLDIDLTKLLLNSSRDVFERGDTRVLQPLIYAVEIGLAEVWKALGIRPTVVIGHSLGEYAAAVTAGVLSVEDGARIVARRSQIMSDIQGNAGMLSTDLSRADADEICRLWPMIDLSAENGSRSHVLSGPTEKLTELEAELKSGGIRAKRLSVSHAFHSRQMDGVLAQFAAGIQSIQFAAPKIRFLSTVTGDRADQSIICNTKYWTDHIRMPVLFGPAIQRTKDEGIDTLIEIGPGEALITMGRLNRPGDGLVWLGSISSGKPDSECLLQSIAELHVSGVQCNWEQVVGLGGGETTEVPGSLPLYPFTKKVFSNVWAGRAAGESDVLRGASSEVQNSASVPHQVPESSVSSLESGIRAIISDLLGLEDPAALDASTEFGQMGLDSVMAIKARDRISRLMSGSKELPQTLVFEHPTLERLLAHLAPGSGQQAERESAKEQIENRWVKVPRRRPEAKLRIYCMHYATGSTNMYRNWPDLIHPEVEVRPIQLPGRWERLREPLFSESGPLVDALFKAIAPELDQIPYALFGYSLGGVLSWELCRRVRKAGLPLPVHLFPAASMPPQMIFNTETHSAPEGTLLRAVDKILGGVPHQLVQEAAGNVTFPIIRSDFAVFDNYQYEPQEPFDFPITAFGGLQDVLVTPKFLEFWSTHTRGRYSERYFHGGHFFFLTEESKIISELNLILDDGLRKGATR